MKASLKNIMRIHRTISRSLLFITAFAILASLVTNATQAAESSETETVKLFTVITSDSPETQFMALVLSMQSAQQGAEVRILLCDQAGELALRDKTFEKMQPLDRSPRDLLENLIEAGARVDVCAIFLPNRDQGQEDLIADVGIARPDEVAAYMLKEGVRYFSF